MALLDTFKKKKKGKATPLFGRGEDEGNEVTQQKNEQKKAAGKRTHGTEDKGMKPGVARIDESSQGGEQYASVILKPHITEKAASITSESAYTFVVAPTANKQEVKKAVREIYNIEPVRVNIVNIPSKRVTQRGRRGVKSGYKKAIVYLKKGDRIEFV